MNKVILLCICICIFIISCKKSSSGSSNATIQAKWQVDNLVQHDHSPYQDTTSTIVGVAGDYIDFRTDGKVYTSLKGSNDTSYYSVPNNNTVIINSYDTLNIVTLTTSNLKLYQKLNTYSQSYTELTYNLKR